jgi:hypothetical protein
LSLKQRAALLFNVQPHEIVFLLRDLSIFIDDDLIVEHLTMQLCAKSFSPFFALFPYVSIAIYLLFNLPYSGKCGFIIDCDPVFPVEFKLFDPHTSDSQRSHGEIFLVSRSFLVNHYELQLRKSFSVPSDHGCLLITQLLPDYKLGWKLLKVYLRFLCP